MEHMYHFNGASGSSAGLLESGGNSSSGNLTATAGGSGSADRPRVSLCAFLWDVMRFHDIVGVITYKGDLYQSVPMGDDGELQ